MMAETEPAGKAYKKTIQNSFTVAADVLVRLSLWPQAALVLWLLVVVVFSVLVEPVLLLSAGDLL